MTTAASLPRVPEGLRDLMKVYTKEVLREKPADLYGFSANFFNVIVGEKSQKMVRKYEPVQTYETIMKNRVRQQVPLSLVFNIIPETLTDLIKQFIKAVLREKPENIYIFAQEYFQRMSKEKEKSGRIEYTKYSTYEKSLKDKENVTPGSKVTCECGRILSGKAKDVENRYTDTKLAEADQRTFSSRITYLQSVVIIQRQIRRFLKERKIVRDKDKCNSVEYVAAILLIQRQVRRFLAKKRVEKLKNSRDVREAKGKFNTGDYMKAVVVIQRHYRIYLKKKQERNRLKSDPVSLATAAIIIQRAFRRMVARHRAKRNASSAADQAEELNDNASETGSYTSVSTALLSTESTELGMATYEERVHQKIIHEDEEVENKNVDAGLEKEYSAETIKGQEKSMNLRKSEILSGALIENMIRKPSLENIKDFHNESKDLGEEMDIEVDEKKTSQDLEPEIKSNKSSLELETVAKAELKTKKDNEELESEFSTKNASLDVESSTQDEPKTEHTSEDIEPKNDDKVKTENFGTKSIKEENGDSEFQNIIEKRESDDGKEHDEDVQNDEKEDANILDNDKIIKSKNELTETSIKKEVTPMVSIEIEHVDDLLEDSIPTHHDSNDDSAKDSTNGDSTAQESKYMSNVEIYSLTTVLVNHNREIREQESPVEPLDDKNLEISADTLVQTQTEENHSSVEDENETTPKSREKRSIEDKEMVQSNLENQESLITEDISLTNESNANLKPINHDEIQKGNEQKLKVDGSLDTIPAMEDISKTQSDTKGEIRSTSSEEKIIKEASIPEITSDKDPKIEDPITEDKEMIKTSISVTKDEPLDPNITNIAEKSDLPKLQMKSESIDDLELNKRDSELIIHAGTDPLKENGENSMEILHHANEKVPTDDATEETDSILKLLQQDTIPIRSESLMTEEMVPSEGEVPNDDSHNFDVFTEGIDLKNKKNVSSPSNSKEFSDEQPIKDINDSMGESIVQEQHLLVEDPSGTSVEREFEGVDAQSDTKEENKTNATELQQNIETSIEDAVTDGKVSTEKLESSRVKGQHSDKETLPINSEPENDINLKSENSPVKFDKISSEESESLHAKEQQSENETLPINSQTRKDVDPNLENEADELDQILTKEPKSSSAEVEQSNNETLPINSVPKTDINPSLEVESAKLDKILTEESEILRAEDQQSENDILPINSEPKKDETLNLEDEAVELVKILTEKPESSQADNQQSENKTFPIDSEPEHAKEMNTAGKTEISTNESERSRNVTEQWDEEGFPIKPESVQVEDGKLPNESSEANGVRPEDSEVRVLHTNDKTQNSLDETTVGTEKILPTSLEKSSSSALGETSKSEKELLEYPTNSNSKEISMGDTAIAVMESSAESKNESITAQTNKEESKDILTEDSSGEESTVPPTAEPDKDNYDSESITKTATSKSTEVESEESVDHTKLESDLEKDIKDEGHTGAHLERDSSEHPTKTSATDTLHLEQKEDSTDFGSTSAVVEDKDNAESTPKSDSPVPLNTEQKNSSLLVSNQLIGTQNLPTNHIEIEKNTKKLSNPIVKDKDIGTLTSGRLVPTPIAELQLKSFKTPNDDGAWYDIYVEPKVASDKDLESIPTSVQSKKSDTDEQTAEVVEEPIIIAERVPSYYTPKEIIEPTIPKAKNSVSFFVSFDSDDGNPKYKIPKKFRDQSKTDNNKKAVNNEDIPSESDVDSNEEEIEVIEVSEGDPEYQQTGGSKLQTILELDNESEQPTEFSNQRTALELNGPVDTVEDNREETKSTKSNSEKFEAAYKTDILTITRSVLIIERAYRQFMSRHSLKSETNKESNFTKQNQAAKIIQKWLRNSLRIKSIKVSSDISQKSKESSAAKKIQRAYRKYVEKSKEIKSANGLLPQERTKEEKMAALVIQKAFREYSQRKYDNLNKIQSSDDTELEQNKAAQKIQRAYRRYLKLSDKSEPQEVENPVQGNSSLTYSSKLTDKPEEIDDLMTKELKALTQSSISIDTLKSTINPEILNDLKTDELQNAEPVEETVSNPIQISILADEPKRIKELKSDEFQELENLSKVSSSPIHLSKSLDESENITKKLSEEKKETPVEAISKQILTSKSADELEMINDVEKGGEANTTSVQDKTEIIEHKDELITNHPLKDQLERKFSAALIIQRAFRQYMERKKLENFDESSLDSITSSRITAIETSNYPTAGTTPSESLVPEAAEDPGEDASKIQPKSEWFVGSTRIIPSQEVVEKPLGVATDPDPDAITSKTELDTSTQVESVETVDRTHGSLESKLTPGISSSKIDESLGVQSEKDNAVSSGLAGLTEAAEEGLDSVEDPLLLSQSDFGGIVQYIVSTQELVNNFLENEIEYSSKQGPFPSASLLEEVVEEPCIKKSASLVNLSEGESEPDVASQKAENTDSSVSETIGLDTLSADTIDKATVKLSKPEEVIEKMSQFRDSKSHERLPSADPSFDEPVVRPMSLLQEQSSMDIEDGDIIVYNRLQRDETRESSAQSDSVVFGEAESENIQDKDLLNEEESGRVHLIRHYTIAGDDPRGLFRSVTIDDALNYGEMGKNNQGINNTNSFCLDDETSENIRKKMMAYSLSETDSDYFDPRKSSKEDFDIDTAMADAMGTSTETESTIVSAATKIQAGARGFLTRRRLRRASAGTKSSTLDTKASFGNDAISESLERFIEEEAAKKIQAAYRMHTRKRRSHNRKMEGISLESNLAARRQKLQRGDALRNDSTPDDENSVISSEGKAQKSSKPQKKKTVGETKSKADMELKWLKMRQNSMPVQIDCEVFRVIPKHMRKRIKSAEANKRK
ncbi:uro-adherence factor A isoform X3 [Drosophila takahashii]|uniref:uro-adherence factor A isoform X3 n=1 Tax=Drosophila takahashii TaxID=29030 RepID=UPI00389912C9